jgi:cadmium resistance protein CadD (predicted permease)
LLGIHRNPNSKEFLKCYESWDMLWIFLGYGTIIMLEKKSFGQIIFDAMHEIKKKNLPKDFF